MKDRAELLRKINKSQLLQSLLYELDLMPEQVPEGSRIERRMRAVVMHLEAFEFRKSEFDRLTKELEAVRKDCLTLAMRLYGESEGTFAPETAEVMKRMRVEIEKIIGGKS